ncbi:rCG63553 [Rattus norvegicus]|uniref:RCG63553 n=1 Tax=Rattus norvegicus TaxID=10116 RepID=A6JBM4_RAT|nr:rCG63553 [Rattus norvegicus]
MLSGMMLFSSVLQLQVSSTPCPPKSLSQ